MSNLELRAVANYFDNGRRHCGETTGPSRRSVFEPKYQGRRLITNSSIPRAYPAMEPPWATLNAIDLNKG